MRPQRHSNASEKATSGTGKASVESMISMSGIFINVIVWVNVADMQTTLFVQGSMFLVVCSIVCSATSLIEAFPRSLRLSD